MRIAWSYNDRRMLERAKGIGTEVLLTKATESFGDAYEPGNLSDARWAGSECEVEGLFLR
jgi:hypothetical protein